jgi:hypothetical protein
MVDAGEACDGADLAGEDCVSQGFLGGGVLACLGDCSGLDTTGCMASGSGDCCAAHDSTGCDDAGCEAVICGFDPFCCDTVWDGICADEALADPACVDVGGSCPCQDEDIGSTTGPAVTSGNTGGDDDDIDGSCGGGGGNDRVILFTAPADGSYTFDTFGSTYDTKLSLHFDCASEISCNDDAAGGVQSQLVINMTAGQRVMVVVDGYNGATGDWVLNITTAPMMPPVCGDAVVEAPELCDGANLNGQTCVSQGFPGGGTLTCNGSCGFNTNQCVALANPYTTCVSPNSAIPATGLGVASSINVPVGGTVTDVNISITGLHTWVGDVAWTLTKGATNRVMINRVTNGGGGCSGDNFGVTLDDESAGGAVQGQCAGGVPSVGGNRTPNATLNVFDGVAMGGNWTLQPNDLAAGDSGTFQQWCITVAWQ